MKQYKTNVFQKMFTMGFGALLLMSLSIFSSSAAPVNIMPLGDSITHENYRDPGLSGIPEANRTSYRDDLESSLQSANYSVDFVGSLNSGSAFMTDADHEGHNGINDTDLAAAVEGHLNTNPADIVLLHIGTNGDIGDESAADVNDLLDNIDSYELSSGKHVQVILARITNCWGDWNATGVGKILVCTPAFSAHITAFNNNIDTMVATRVAAGDDITVVDMENGAGLSYDASDMIDDLHPNDAGYAKMANVWFEALKTVIPTHQWKLEEAAQPYIDTYRALNGTCGALTSVCPTQTGGITGNAQNFNGSTSSVDVPDDNTFDWTAGDNFTVEFWMKPDNTAGLQVAAGRHEGGTGTASWWVGRSGANVRVSMDGSITSSTVIDTTGTQWTHVAVVRNATTNEVILYINGVKDSNSLTGTTPNSFHGERPFNIGWFHDGFYFDGALDEVTMYDGALNADQVMQRYAAGNIALAIISTPVTTADVGASYVYDVNSNDPSATYALITNPGWMNINAATGEITGTPTPTDVANDAVTVQANNGATANQSFVVKVRDTASLPAGMEHYWKLNENTGTTTYIDEYSAATDATCSGNCPTQDIAGQVDEAQDFSASNIELNVPDDNTFDWAAGDNFTVEFWMKPDNTAGLQVAVGRHQGATGTASWWVGREGTKVKFTMDSSTITSTTDIDTSGNWTHVAMVRNAATNESILYINGVKDNSSLTGTTPNSFDSIEPLNIGWFDSGFYFEGALDEIAIFDSALPVNEIKAHYNNGLANNGFDNPDVTKPIITRLGSTPVDIVEGTPYTDAGATATDDVDANITANIVTVNPVDSNTIGEYNVTYNVSDAAGNIADEVIRTVNVTDATKPVIILLGNPIVNLVIGDPYTDAGATANDNHDGDITGNIVMVNPVNTNAVGQYTVTYNVSDAAGNVADEVIRTVNVSDVGTPVITLLGTTSISVSHGSTYIDAGATASDDVDGNITASIITINPVDTNVIGSYNVTYNVSDTAGNNAVEAVRVVNVVDDTKPVITRLGNAIVNLVIGDPYTDAGATANDNHDGDITGNIVMVNPVNTNAVGQYTVTYNVSDAAGNVADEVTRTVNVVENTTPPIEPDWLEKDGNTYSVGDSSVEVDPSLGIVVVVTTDKVTFTKTDASGKEAYIEMLADGSIVTGYTEGTNNSPTSTTGFPVGTKVQMIQDGADTVIVIDTPLTTDLTLVGGQ